MFDLHYFTYFEVVISLPVFTFSEMLYMYPEINKDCQILVLKNEPNDGQSIVASLVSVFCSPIH